MSNPTTTERLAEVSETLKAARRAIVKQDATIARLEKEIEELRAEFDSGGDAFSLAMLAMQSERYQEDAEYRGYADAVLARWLARNGDTKEQEEDDE